MQSDNFNEIVYFLNNLFCSTHRYIIYIANKMKAVVTLRNKRVHSPQSLAQRRKNSWLIDCIVSTTADALGWWASIMSPTYSLMTTASNRESILI